MKRDHFESTFTLANGSLTITAQGLGDESFTDSVLTPFVESDTFTIEEASPLPAGADQVRVTGRAALPGAGLAGLHSVEGTFELIAVGEDGEGQFRARLVFDLGARAPEEAPWTFAESFPELPASTATGEGTAPPPSEADLLEIGSPRFVVSNVAHDDPDLGLSVQPGLNFVGEWRSGEAPVNLAAFAFATGAADEILLVHGPILLEEPDAATDASPIAGPPSARGIHLRAALGWQASLPESSDPLFRATLTEVRFFSPLDQTQSGAERGTALAYVGEFDLPALGLSAGLTLRHRPGSPYAFLGAEFGSTGSEGLSLGELTGLVGMEAAFESLPAEVTEKLGALTLRSVELTLDTSGGNPRVALFAADVGLDDLDMQVFEGVFELSDLGLVATVLDPFEERVVSGTVLARTSLLGMQWDLSLGVPDGLLSASLAEGVTLDFKALFGEFGLPVLIDDLSIDRIELSGQPGKSYTVTTRVAESSPLRIEVGPATIELRNLALDLTRTAGPPGSDGTTGALSASLTLGETALTLRAELPHSADDGWELVGFLELEDGLPVNTLLEDLLAELGGIELPAAIGDFVVRDLIASFHTRTRDFTFELAGTLPLSVGEVNGLEARVQLELLHQSDGSTNKRLAGQVRLGSLQFDLVFSQVAAQDAGVPEAISTMAAVFHAEEGVELVLRDMLEGQVPEDVLGAVPASLSITLHDAFLAYQRSGVGDATESRFLVALDMGTGIDFSNLPLIGESMPAGQRAQLGYRLLVASSAFKSGDVELVDALLPDGVARLLGEEKPAPDDVVVARGLGLAVDLQLGSFTLSLASPVEAPTEESSQAAAAKGGGALPVVPKSSEDEGVKWVDVKKSFGPAHFQRIGVRFKDGELAFLIDASLSAGGMTLSMDGLSISSPLDEFKPSFDLRGIGIEYKGGPVRVGGAFLRIQRDGFDEYVGKATLKTKQLTLTALGAYTKIDGETSLFIYAVLDYPIGGPSFFFITGLAAGFGYNREVLMPPIDQVAEFPLVGVATGSLAPAPDPTAELRRLSEFILPRIDQHFLCVGLKFNSFKLIDSFAMLAISFGERFRLDLLGISKLVVPTPLPGEAAVDPIAEIELALKASFVPDEGLLSVEAQLTKNSYILSRKCSLTGGFAFFSWFGGPHEGDFVVSLGGYHPNFKVPAHYPTVPRLGFHWDVDSHLTVKGSAYMALTASAVMAGGALEANYHSGDLKAWFHAHADFLLAWKPYHYEISMGVEIGASYTIHFFGTHELRLTLGASLEIWGPEFAGHAEVDLGIITIPVDFGANGKSSAAKIDWPTFRDSFLPAEEEVVSISLQTGLLRNAPPQSPGESEVWIVNPKELSFVTNSAVPVNLVQLGGVQDPQEFKELATGALTVALLELLGGQEVEDEAAVLRAHDVPLSGEETEAELDEKLAALLAAHRAAAKPMQPFDIGTMQVTREQVRSVHGIEILEEDGSSVEGFFAYEPVFKNVPTALWGPKLSPKENDPRLVPGTLAGFRVRPAAPPVPGETQPLERSKLRYDIEPVSGQFSWLEPQPFREDPSATDDATRRARVTAAFSPGPASSSRLRGEVLSAMGMDPALIDVNELPDFVRQPRIEAPL